MRLVARVRVRWGCRDKRRRFVARLFSGRCGHERCGLPARLGGSRSGNERSRLVTRLFSGRSWDERSRLPARLGGSRSGYERSRFVTRLFRCRCWHERCRLPARLGGRRSGNERRRLVSRRRRRHCLGHLGRRSGGLWGRRVAGRRLEARLLGVLARRRGGGERLGRVRTARGRRHVLGLVVLLVQRSALRGFVVAHFLVKRHSLPLGRLVDSDGRSDCTGSESSSGSDGGSLDCWSGDGRERGLVPKRRGHARRGMRCRTRRRQGVLGRSVRRWGSSTGRCGSPRGHGRGRSERWLTRRATRWATGRRHNRRLGWHGGHRRRAQHRRWRLHWRRVRSLLR